MDILEEIGKIDKLEELDTILGEKWFIRFINKDGSKKVAIINDYNSIPKVIETLRSMGVVNIVITDETILHQIGFSEN